MNLATNIGVAVAALGLVGVAIYGDSVVSRQSDPNKTIVIYWEKWTGHEADEMRKVVKAFNESQNRIEVRYLSISGVDQKTMLATAGGTPPDVAGIWVDQVCQFADERALTDLTEMANQAGLTRDYYIPAYYNALFYRNKLWAFPSTPASIALHVRTDLVPKDVASPDTFPKTLDGLDKLSDRITKRLPDGSLQLAGFLPSDPGWWNWAWPGLFGGSLLDKNGNPCVNSPEAIRAFTWIASYAKRYGSKEVSSFQSGFGDFGSQLDPFMDGKVATEMNGVWKASYIQNFKPGLKWFAVPFPYPDDRPDLAGHSVLSQDVLTIPRGAKHVKEAFEFIKFIQRQDVMEGLCSGHGKNSPLNKVSQKFFENHPNKFIRLFDRLARSPKAVNEPQIGIYPNIANEMTVAFQAVMADEKTPKQALDYAQDRLMVNWNTYRSQVLGEKN